MAEEVQFLTTPFKNELAGCYEPPLRSCPWRSLVQVSFPGLTKLASNRPSLPYPALQGTETRVLKLSGNEQSDGHGPCCQRHAPRSGGPNATATPQQGRLPPLRGTSEAQSPQRPACSAPPHRVWPVYYFHDVLHVDVVLLGVQSHREPVVLLPVHCLVPDRHDLAVHVQDLREEERLRAKDWGGGGGRSTLAHNLLLGN